MNDQTVYKIALAGLFHDIGKFSERASGIREVNAVGFFPDENFLYSNMDLYQPHFKEKYTHKHSVYTAAFIDHLEKLLPKEFNKGEWGIEDSFVKLAAGHHKPQTALQWIIAVADRVSSGYDRKTFDDYNHEINVKDYKKTRLLTLFEGIDNPKEDKLEAYDYRYPLREISPKNIFPIRSDNSHGADYSEEYRELFFKFVCAIEKLEHKDTIPLWLEHYDSIFCIYCSHIPAATVGFVVPDVSLYDHSKMTSALSSALYLYHKSKNSFKIEDIQDYEKKKFLMISGDFYGIQNFIFSSGGSTNKASAKLLRGRSFAVSLISELAADFLCREIGLTHLSIILNAAGKFVIIAPNTEECIKKIKDVEEEINNWLIKWFFGEFSLGICFEEASCGDFVSGNFDITLEKLAKESEKKKFSKIDIEKYGGAVENYLDNFDNTLNSKLCPFCGKRPSDKDLEGDDILAEAKSSCRICRDHIYMGTMLVKSEKIAITTPQAKLIGSKLTEPIFGKYQASFDVEGKLSSLAKDGDLLKYWNIAISKNDIIATNISSKFINGYVPTYDEEDLEDERYLSGKKREDKKIEMIDQIKEKVPKTFAHIALKAKDPKTSDGVDALGLLKADVDNLGAIFSYKLKRNTLSRMASLSRQLNFFFSIYIPYILSTKFKDIYTVFSGGDDLFLIGPYNKIIQFAHFLNSSFNEYVCKNPAITISAGISLSKSSEPVIYFAERAEGSLKKSKESGRDSITLFNETVKWNDFSKLEEIKKKMLSWIEDKKINNAFLFKLNTFVNMAKKERDVLKQECIEIEDMECLKWRSMFKYNLVRNIGKELKGEEKEEAIKEIENSAQWLDEFKGAIKIPLWQIIYKIRKGG